MKRILEFVLLLTTACCAVDNVWSAASAGNWSTPTNWSLGHAPIDGESCVFDGTSAQNCTVDVDSTCLIYVFRTENQYTGTFNLNSKVLRFSNNLSVVAGWGGTWTMTGTLRSSGASKVFCSFTVGGNINLSGLIVHFQTDAYLRLVYTSPRTIARLILTAGKTYQWDYALTADALTITTAAEGDWDNSIWECMYPGSTYRIIAPAGVVVTGLSVTDCYNLGADVTVMSGTDGGGNDGFVFTTPVSPDISFSVFDFRFSF